MKNYRKEEAFIMDFEKIFEYYGYEKIKLNTFEKYDTYFTNKDIINPNGDLYVLRPDMTLPVVKYFFEQQTQSGKFYYSDSVFRADKKGLEFNERKQVGIEYLGGENILSDIEILDLAVQTLEKLDHSYILCISNTEFIKEMIETLTEEKEQGEQILEYLYRRSSDLESYLVKIDIEEEKITRLLQLNKLFGNFKRVKETLYKMAVTDKQRKPCKTC
ncbi:ATP phosphoribosyltransferase regulatory subunit [Fusobacteria bacterium ZRK30]|nr:ATP phosphoribosyltransferase regulatory subunit [Fusobacteria bacterium ZRK30]